MSLFKGLFSFEIILMVCGSLLFLLLLISLGWCIVKSKPYFKLLPFFVMTVLMIGFPSIKKFSYDKGKISFEKATDSLSQHPRDSALRAQVTSQLEKIRTRAANDPKGLLAMANAHWALGNYDSSLQFVSKARALDPAEPQLAVITEKIKKDQLEQDQFKENISRLNKSILNIYASQGDKHAIAKNIAQLLDTLIHPTYISPVDALDIGRGYAVLNQRGEALRIADTLILAYPGFDSAVAFKTAMLSMQFLNDQPILFRGVPQPVKAMNFDGSVISAIH